MVSNVLDMEPEQLVAALQQLRATLAADPDYQRLRGELPADWPV
jgi:hypothetical protein